MKRNNDFILKELDGKFVLIPFGQKAVDFNGVITLNETAKFLWEKSEEEFDSDKLKAALIYEYSIDDETAKSAVELFIAKLKEAGCINE